MNTMSPHNNPLRAPPPPLDRPTVEFALRLAPDKCPRPEDNEREIWMQVGARRLAEKLLLILEKQENETLVPHP